MFSGGQTTVLKKTMVKSHKPVHKPKTYAQQLQELQPDKPLTGKANIINKPVHKPKTYAKQLQELQPDKPLTGKAK